MALAVNKILLAGSNNATNTPGAYFQSANVVVNTAGANLNVVIAAGVYYANTPSNCSVYCNMNSSSNVVVLGANTAGLVLSDGINVFANTTTNGTLIMITVDGGIPVSTTFSS